MFLIAAHCLKQAAIYAGQPYAAAAGLAQQRDQVLVHFSAQDHLHDIHRLIIGAAQTVDKLALLADLVEHLADLRPAAMDEHDLDADQVEQHDILDDRLFELFIDHGIAAIFDDDDLSRILLDIRERLDEDLGLDLGIDPGHVR